MHLVLIETSGNQDYIFATNKLRENVGASELVWRVGYRFTEEAAEQVPENVGASEQTHRLGQLAADVVEQHEAPVSSYAKVRLKASGKVIIETSDVNTARRIVAAVTRRVLEEAPGMDVRGAVLDLNGKHVHEVVKQLHRRHEELRGCVPGPAERFLRLPIIAECSTSGLPAACFEQVGNNVEMRSPVSWAKRRAAEEGWRRLRENAGDVPLAPGVDVLDEMDLEWLAVVHADGNGLGQMFLKFDELVGGLPGKHDTEQYLSKLGQFSEALDVCTNNAFRFALQQIWPRWNRRRLKQKYLPLVPLVLGGDDLTVMCDGRLAIPFTESFLQKFEQETQHGIVGELAAQRPDRQRGKLPGRLAACAGVAIVKPHFPFYAAYGLAEQLLRSAKKVKEQAKLDLWPCSAFDVHVLYDASGADLDRIRASWSVDGGTTRLTSRPFVVTPQSDLTGAPVAGQQWAKSHQVTRIRACLAKINARDEGRRVLPNSMLHELREDLFQGRTVADARLQLALGRHDRAHFGLLISKTTDEDTLFRDEGGIAVTTLLDALDLADFWEA